MSETVAAPPSGITVRHRHDEDDPAVVALWHALAPEFPAMPVEDLRAMRAQLPPWANHIEFVAERDGHVVAFGHLMRRFWTDNEGSYTLGVDVHPGEQSQGIGGCLYRALLPYEAEWGARRVFAEAREDRPAAVGFAERRGFAPTGHVTRHSRLDVHQANFRGYEGLEDRLHQEGIVVTSLAQLGAGDEQVLRRLYALDMETAKDEPSSEAFRIPFEQWLQFQHMPGISPATTFVAVLEDEFIGLTRLQRQGPDAAWHSGMGTLRSHRGRGVARLLKYTTIQYALANGIRYLYTGNDINNPRMYSINIRLGYEPIPSRIEFARDAQL